MGINTVNPFAGKNCGENACTYTTVSGRMDTISRFMFHLKIVWTERWTEIKMADSLRFLISLAGRYDPGYDGVAFDLSRRGQIKGDAIIAQGRNVVLMGFKKNKYSYCEFILFKNIQTIVL